MKEIEVKILEVDGEEIEKRLLELGAKKTLDGEIDAVFFDTPDFRLKNEKSILRLRTYGSKVFLTYKKAVSNKNVKVRDEYETEVSDFETTQNILKRIGLVPRDVEGVTRKHRVSYQLEKTHFELDKYDDEKIPLLLEIEAPEEETVYEYAKKLGFEKKNCNAWTASKVIKHYTERKT